MKQCKYLGKKAVVIGAGPAGAAAAAFLAKNGFTVKVRLVNQWCLNRCRGLGL